MNDTLQADHSRLNKYNWRNPDYRNILRRLEDMINKTFGIPIMEEGQQSTFAVDHEPIMEVVDGLIGRETELSLIESHLQRKEGKGLMVVTLHGLGGIGKTQLASAYFNKPPQSYSARFRLEGSSKPKFESDFLKIAEAAGLSDNSAALPETPTQRIWDWLNLKDNNMWLILLDNVDDPGNGTGQVDVSNFLGNVRQGSVVITTRLQCLIPNSEAVVVGRLKTGDALRVLKHHAGRDIIEGKFSKDCVAVMLI